jgi:predicted lipid-binding transport protein (Tim44 family)
VRNWFRIHKKNNQLHLCNITWAKVGNSKVSEYDGIIQAIEKTPKFFDSYQTAPEAPKTAPASEPTQSTVGSFNPTPREAFEISVTEMVEAEGLGTEKIDAELKACGYANLQAVPEADFDGFKKHLSEVL